MSTSELHHAVVTLGSRSVIVAYPHQLSPWFAQLSSTETSVDTGAWVRLDYDDSPECFRIAASSGQDEKSLGLGDALAAIWEGITLLLIDQIDDAIALHAAVARQGHDFVLLPGSSGTGKTQLALWYRAQGFALATDELLTVSLTAEDNGALRAATLARPLFLKSPADSRLLPAGGLRVKHGSSNAEILLPEDIMLGQPQPIQAGLMVFPRHVSGSALHLKALTPAQAGLRLLEHCVNVRNLVGGGLRLAAAMARRLPAVSLRYGDIDQFAGTLDVLTRQLLATTPSVDDLEALCDGLTARAGYRNSTVSMAIFTRIDHQPPVPAGPLRRLTIGMATYDDYDGVYFTIQSIRLNHPELAFAIEFIVIDNHPGGPCSDALKQLEGWIDGYRYVTRGDWHGTAIRNAIFEEATCEIVVCVDAHILIVPGALSRLVDYFHATSESRDLIQGPLLFDDLRSTATHFEPHWRAGMFGTWATDPRGADPGAPPFEIPMQGLGLFACRKDAWPGFNSSFRGFGGEEGYIHEKFRQRGDRTLCLPFLRWVHRFTRPLGAPYVPRWEDRVRNYYIGFTELGLDTSEMETHFAELIGRDNVNNIVSELRTQLPKRVSGSTALRFGERRTPGSMQLSDSIYNPHHYSFGDQWATINFYLNMSVATKTRIRLASIMNGVDLYDVHRDILNVLDSPGEIELIRSEPTMRLDTYNVWSSPYFHTKKRWVSHHKHKYVAVQFDGQSVKELKNASPEEEANIRAFLNQRCPGLELIALGKPLSVQQCVNIAADSAFFVGVDSGMSHLCHSVGVPIFLLEYHLPTVTTHFGKSHILCRGFEDFENHFERYRRYLHATKSPDAESVGDVVQVPACRLLAQQPDDEVDDEMLQAQSLMTRARPSDPARLRSRLEGADQYEPSGRQARVRRILSAIALYEVPGFAKVRIGNSHDGGYLLIDDLQGIKSCYSFGIGLDASWDYEMAQHGATVFQYDHTITASPQHHAGLRFFPVRVGAVDGENVRTIQGLLEENGHASELEMILKMDIEGSEWDVLDQSSSVTLNRFKQIICEFHGFSELHNPSWCERAERVLLKLTESHLPVHVHGNNFASFNIVEGVPVPDVIEVTYARRSSYSFGPSATRFPTNLDRPNNPGLPDFYLGRFEF